MDKANIRNYIMETLKLEIEDNFYKIHAAIGLFVMLGRVYIWPIEYFDNDLRNVITKANELLVESEFNQDINTSSLLKNEIEELEFRVIKKN
jgi:hypothetical protein